MNIVCIKFFVYISDEALLHYQGVNMKSVILVLVLLVSSSCAKYLTRNPSEQVFTDNIIEKMMPNGHWDLSLYSEKDCSDKIATDQGNTGINIIDKPFSELFKPTVDNSNDPILLKRCNDIFQSRLETRASVLCANEGHTFYACNLVNGSTPERDNTKLVYTCYSKCKSK